MNKPASRAAVDVTAPLAWKIPPSTARGSPRSHSRLGLKDRSSSVRGVYTASLRSRARIAVVATFVASHRDFQEPVSANARIFSGMDFAPLACAPWRRCARKSHRCPQAETWGSEYAHRAGRGGSHDSKNFLLGIGRCCSPVGAPDGGRTAAHLRRHIERHSADGQQPMHHRQPVLPGFVSTYGGAGWTWGPESLKPCVHRVTAHSDHRQSAHRRSD